MIPMAATISIAAFILLVGVVLSPWVGFGAGCWIGGVIAYVFLILIFVYDAFTGWNIRKAMRKFEGIE